MNSVCVCVWGGGGGLCGGHVCCVLCVLCVRGTEELFFGSLTINYDRGNMHTNID